MAVEGKVKGGVSKKVDAAFKKPLPKGGEAKEAVKEEVKAEAPLVKLSDSQMSEALTAFTKLLAIQVLLDILILYHYLGESPSLS